MYAGSSGLATSVPPTRVNPIDKLLVPLQITHSTTSVHAEPTASIQLCVTRSSSLQRLDTVNQAGNVVFLPQFKPHKPVTRLEHSIGCALLVKRLGGDHTQQVAALLHDITHRAFSHVADVLYKDRLKANQDSYHEVNVSEFVNLQTDLPNFFSQSDLKSLIDLSQHPIVEQPTPTMCADRIDYFLRDVIAWQVDCPEIGLVDNLTRRKWVDEFVDSLTVASDGIMATTDVKLGVEASILFMCLNDQAYISKESVGVYQLTAVLLKKAIAYGIIADVDLDVKGDQEIWNAVKEGCGGHRDMTKIWTILNSEKTEYLIVECNDNVQDGWTKIASNLQLKMRYVDPHIVSSVNKETARKASAMDSRLRQTLSEYRYKGLKKWDVYYKFSRI
ncbi:hypothetical protein SeMB42_g03507 [Synchytrium endobioticum]|uniref:HD/PDEase domain-containing protein n=1 Tax=Synchytrium endobioticum TaxID=286115 RepID=A0A507D090_9FUNG|nr:hypothetical protein SeLEV6574_g04285 [Synchytrium endobioticum]TPX47011.1 hypothetical protein SeMB42_g03507 [Synchytrium endobioticum]